MRKHDQDKNSTMPGTPPAERDHLEHEMRNALNAMAMNVAVLVRSKDSMPTQLMPFLMQTEESLQRCIAALERLRDTKRGS